MPTSPIHTFSAGQGRIEPLMNPEDAGMINVELPASVSYPSGTILGEQIGTDEVSTITIDATGGTFTITYGAQTTAALAWNASAATVQAALEALSSVGVGNVKVTLAGLVYTLVWRNALGSTNVSAPTTTATNLTGGAGTAAVATGTSGVAGFQGRYAAYASGNSDGSQIPKGILVYDCSTDSSRNISLGAGTASEHGETQKSAPMWFQGIFRCEDTVGLDTNAISKLGRLLWGTYAHGALSMYGS